MERNVNAALLLTFFAGLATAIGGLIVVVFNPKNLATLGVVLSFASGVMIYISFMDLLPEAQMVLGFGTTNVYFFIGMAVFHVLTKLIPEPELPTQALRALKAARKHKEAKSSEENLWTAGVLTAVGIAAHNVPEGIAVYVACLRGVSLGLPLAVAIAAHNIPEGMAVASPILGATGSRWLAFKYTLYSGLCEPAGALLVGYFFTSYINNYVIQCTLAAVAGVMVLISLRELVPQTLKHLDADRAMLWHVAGMASMAVSVWLLHYRLGFHQHVHPAHTHGGASHHGHSH